MILMVMKGTSNLVVALDIALQLLSFEIESVDAFSIAGLDLAYVALSHSLFDLLEVGWGLAHQLWIC